MDNKYIDAQAEAFLRNGGARALVLAAYMNRKAGLRS
jgi:hypothetical protein